MQVIKAPLSNCYGICIKALCTDPREILHDCDTLCDQIGNRSSSYTVESSVRGGGGSYIYEEFLATDGVDVKVYTVGPDYAHAEARKCPVRHALTSTNTHLTSYSNTELCVVVLTI